MTSQEYILERLRGLTAKKPTQLFASQTELVDFLYKATISKKFRKYHVNPEYQKHIRSAIEYNVKNNEPIKIVLVFGGYKLWRLDEAPEPDWAELFSMIYYAYWIKPIADNYKPGVWFDFYSDDIIVRTIDNIPEQDTEAYIKNFCHLLDFLKSFLPRNIKFTLNRVGEQYDSYQTFQNDLNEKTKKIKNKQKPLNQEQETTLELNVKLTSEQKKDPKWKEKVSLVHDAYTLVEKRRPYYRAPDKIIAITRPANNSIAVGTTKTSVVKFWIGVGALQKKANTFIETILSPSQLEATKYGWSTISIPDLKNKNFQKIRII